MLLVKKIRILVSQSDTATLEFMQAKCRGLYNWWIAKLKNGEPWKLYEAKKSLSASKQYDKELKYVYGKLLAEVYFRLEKAMAAFFRRVADGEKPGFPRFKPRHQFFTLKYPGAYLAVGDGKIILPTGGKGKEKKSENVVAHLTESPPPSFKEVAVTKDSRGRYYCCFVYETNSCPPSDNPTYLAIDLGIKTLVSGVNEQGRVYQIGGFKGYRWFNRQLDTIRAKRARCKKGSRRYYFLSKVYQLVAEKKRNKLVDSLHKASGLIAYKLAESAVVIGELSQRQMVRKSNNKFRNRAVFNDWGLYQFVVLLKYKCVKGGKSLHIISERDTSKTCSRCSHQQDMPLYKRTYHCPSCSLVMDRDTNSAINILMRFLARLAPHKLATVCGVLGVIQAIDTFTHV